MSNTTCNTNFDASHLPQPLPPHMNAAGIAMQACPREKAMVPPPLPPEMCASTSEVGENAGRTTSSIQPGVDFGPLAPPKLEQQASSVIAVVARNLVPAMIVVGGGSQNDRVASWVGSHPVIGILVGIGIFAGVVGQAIDEVHIQRRRRAASEMAMRSWSHLVGNGVRQDPKQAHFWAKQSSDAGAPAGTYMLGVLNARGFGVKRCDQAAIDCFQRAAKAGDPVAKIVVKRLRRR